MNIEMVKWEAYRGGKVEQASIEGQPVGMIEQIGSFLSEVFAVTRIMPGGITRNLGTVTGCIGRDGRTMARERLVERLSES